MNKIEIMDWIVNEAGICPTPDNHFGGNPNAQPTSNAYIQQRPGELASCIEWLYYKAVEGERLEYYAEIGACAGGTSLAMHNFLHFTEMLIIDDGGAQNIDFYVNQRKDQSRGLILGTIPRIEIIGNSTDSRVIEISRKLSAIHQYDILFIDGDHSYNGVKLDTINYLPIVRNGGYVIFHDVTHLDDIKRWLGELPNELSPVATFSESDPYTTAYKQGIGLGVYKKVS